MDNGTVTGNDAGERLRAEEPGRATAPVDVEALIGSPAKVLLQVLGHRGRGGFATALLGSVGLQCVLHGSGPVAIIRPGKQP